MIEVVCGIIRNEERIFICRRNPEKSLGGYWEFPGGKMESKETPEECLKRELREELKMEVDVGDFFTSNVHDYGSFQINLISYFCDFIESEYRMTDHDRFEWLLPEEIGEFKLAPADVPIYVKLIEKEIQN